MNTDINNNTNKNTNNNTNNNTNKWTLEEERKLVFKLRGGTQMKDIAESSGRSYGAIKERLKKIIYENINDINNNNEIRKVALQLNLGEELVKKYYEAYRDRNQNKNVETKVNGETNRVNGESNRVNGETKVNGDAMKEINQTGGAHMAIRKQNELLEDILKNHELKKKVGKLVKTKQIDNYSKEVLKKILLNLIKQ